MEKWIPSKIGIFCALQLGDMLCTVPALRALRQAYPKAKITLISLPWAIEFANRFSRYIDGFISFPGFPGLPEQEYKISSFIHFIQKMQKEKFDLILQMHGDGSIVNPLLQLCGAKKVAGFYRQHSYCPDPYLFLAYPENISEVERHIKLMEFLHIRVKDKTLEFPIRSMEEKVLQKTKQFKALRQKNYICIHPGARDSKRRWKIKYFSYIADKLAKKGYCVAITGTKSELPIIKEMTSSMRTTAFVFAGKTTLGTLGSILKSSELLITNCTGPSHIADALHVPSIVIYTASDPTRWAPLNGMLHKKILPSNIDNPSYVLSTALQMLHQRTVTKHYSLKQKGVNI